MGEVFYFIHDKRDLPLLLTKMINYQSCIILKIKHWTKKWRHP